VLQKDLIASERKLSVNTGYLTVAG
jgi:hypothetical protein